MVIKSHEPSSRAQALLANQLTLRLQAIAAWTWLDAVVLLFRVAGLGFRV